MYRLGSVKKRSIIGMLDNVTSVSYTGNYVGVNLARLVSSCSYRVDQLGAAVRGRRAIAFF